MISRLPPRYRELLEEADEKLRVPAGLAAGIAGVIFLFLPETFCQDVKMDGLAIIFLLAFTVLLWKDM